MRRLITVAAASVGIVVAATISMVRQPLPDGAAAYADAVQAMKRVLFYHEKGRSQGCYPDGGGTEPQGDGWYSGRWLVSETWFDAERGSYNEIRGETYMQQDSLGLPDGTIRMRDDDRLKITEMGPRYWAKQRNLILSAHMDLREMAGSVLNGSGVEPRLVSTRPGEWKGKRATILTYETVPPKEKAARGAPTVRTVFTVDPEARLLLAKKQFAVSPTGKEMLVHESEFDYDERPDPALFDPKRVEQRAKKITRAKGGPGVVVSPDHD
jgi:hypothetical protein